MYWHSEVRNAFAILPSEPSNAMAIIISDHSPASTRSPAQSNRLTELNHVRMKTPMYASHVSILRQFIDARGLVRLVQEYSKREYSSI